MWLAAYDHLLTFYLMQISSGPACTESNQFDQSRPSAGFSYTTAQTANGRIPAPAPRGRENGPDNAY